MDQTQTDLRAVIGQPEADTAEPCDEHCDPDCVNHVASVGWDLSFGSRINFHQRYTRDRRLVVSLQLSDDAIAKGQVYRQVKEQQVAKFAQHLLELAAPGSGEPVELLVAFARWLHDHNQLAPAPEGVTDDLDDMVGHFLADRREARAAVAASRG
jgi:hypothetical protein